jgi:hypothetical protein
MSFKGKPVKVIITGDAKVEYEELNKTVGEEISKGIKKSDHQILFKSIKQKIELLKLNPEYGTHVGKEKIPKEYVNNYDVNNIWKVDLPSGWRMIYTIKGSEVEIVALVLDIIDHKVYDKKFGYRSR